MLASAFVVVDVGVLPLPVLRLTTLQTQSIARLPLRFTPVPPPRAAEAFTSKKVNYYLLPEYDGLRFKALLFPSLHDGFQKHKKGFWHKHTRPSLIFYGKCFSEAHFCVLPPPAFALCSFCMPVAVKVRIMFLSIIIQHSNRRKKRYETRSCVSTRAFTLSSRLWRHEQKKLWPLKNAQRLRVWSKCNEGAWVYPQPVECFASIILPKHALEYRFLFRK